MRGARRQADKPGDEVPDDRADQSGENESRTDGDLLLINDAARDGLRHLSRQKCADQIERSRCDDGGFRLERARGDGGSHGIGGVVKSVREVKYESRDDDEHHHNQSCRIHVSLFSLRVFSPLEGRKPNPSLRGR